MTNEQTLTKAHLDTVQPGDQIVAEFQGLTVTGIADHRNNDGAWFTSSHGLLLPPLDSLRFRIAPRTTTVAAEIGTVVWAVTDTFEGALEFRSDESWWTFGGAGNPTLMWSPGDPPLVLKEWQLIRGKVAEA